jgi:uncharacterized protein (DUF2267 family)
MFGSEESRSMLELLGVVLRRMRHALSRAQAKKFVSEIPAMLDSSASHAYEVNDAQAGMQPYRW